MSQKTGQLSLSSIGGIYRPEPKVLGRELEFYISGPIVGPEEYIEDFDEIRHASPNDTVKVYINSGGGDVDTALQYRRVLHETEAHVICSIEGSCCSAATIIFLSGHEFHIIPHCLFMVHNYSGAIVGKGGEMFDQAVFERAWSKDLLEDIYGGFLTSEEITALLNNKDLWMSYRDVVARMQNFVKQHANEKENSPD